MVDKCLIYGKEPSSEQFADETPDAFPQVALLALSFFRPFICVHLCSFATSMHTKGHHPRILTIFISNVIVAILEAFPQCGCNWYAPKEPSF